MSLSALEIAEVAYDDLASVLFGLKEGVTMFGLLTRTLPAGTAAHDVGTLALNHCTEWEAKVSGWVVDMEKRLEALDAAGGAK
jgi:hypothetical protein